MDKSLIANRNVGQITAKGATRKVIAFEDHTRHSRRKATWSKVMLYIRKDVRVLFLLFASLLGQGAATLASWVVIISVTTVRILDL